MHPVPDRVRRLGQPAEKTTGERLGQRSHRGRPLPAVLVVPCRRLLDQGERPAPAIRAPTPPPRASEDLRLGPQAHPAELSPDPRPDLTPHPPPTAPAH